MSTDDERREIAARLREADGLFGILADLIEPEPERTCHVEKYPPNSELYYETCGSCGCILSASWPGDRNSRKASYCPNCGAKVIEE